MKKHLKRVKRNMKNNRNKINKMIINKKLKNRNVSAKNKIEILFML